MQLIRETNINFMKYRRVWIAVSLALVALGVVAVFVIGNLNVGIDFKGGTQLTLRFSERPDVDHLRGVVAKAGVGESQIQRYGEASRNEVMIRTPIAAGTEEGSAQPVVEALRAEYGDKFTVLSNENVGPQAGAELRRKGLFAVLYSLLGMLAYIWIRFELRFGVGALMATVHDVLVTLGLFTLVSFEFNLTTIAAFLTLIGYSVNDTVVVFDRVRENLRRHPGMPLLELMNLSVNQTLSRTLLTGGTTILACIALILFGGEVLRGFAFILAVGVIVGTYSSIYIAGPFALLWEQLFGKSRKRAKLAAAEARPAAAGKGAPPKPSGKRAAGSRR
jgi:preprotein translocase SecF subunit